MAVRRYKGRYWMVDFYFTFPDGRKERVRKRAPGKTRPEAEQYERLLLQELMSPTPSKKVVPTLLEYSFEFIEDYAKNENKPSEVMNKEGILKRYLLPSMGKLRLDEIGVREMAKMKSEMRKRELSDKTVKNALAVLGKLLRYAEECGVIDRVPRIKMPRVPVSDYDFLTFEEAERLLKAIEDRSWHAMVLTALRTGLRYGELCELRWDDVDLVAGRILVRRSFTKGFVTTPKTHKSREVPLSPATIETLKGIRGLRHLRGGLVFCQVNGKRRIHRRADVAIKRFCRAAGLRPIGWHVLRHTFASHLIMRGRSLKEVQELLGHSDVTMTMRYAHLSPQVKRDAVATLDLPSDSGSESENLGQYLGNGSRNQEKSDGRSEFPSRKKQLGRTLTSAAQR